MKNNTKIFVLLAVLAASCAPKKDKYEAFAEDLCVCMKPMADLQNEMTKLFEAGKQDEVMGLMEKGQKIDEEGQACMDALEKKHGKIEGEEAENKAMEALRKACPDIVALMEESAAPNIAPEDMLEGDEPMLEAPVPAGEGENEQ